MSAEIVPEKNPLPDYAGKQVWRGDVLFRGLTTPILCALAEDGGPHKLGVFPWCWSEENGWDQVDRDSYTRAIFTAALASKEAVIESFTEALIQEEGPAILKAAQELVEGLGEYVRQSMYFNPEWRTGLKNMEALIWARRMRFKGGDGAAALCSGLDCKKPAQQRRRRAADVVVFFCETCADEYDLGMVKSHDEAQRLRAFMGSDNPWPLRDVLKKLADAADHLLDHHGCDTHGHETIDIARKRARHLLAALCGPRSESGSAHAGPTAIGQRAGR